MLKAKLYLYQNMNLSSYLTIVIPCKNEGEILDQTLNLINYQSYIHDVTVIVADNSDDDETKELLKNRQGDLFKLKIIKGGLPSTARNNGAKLVKTPYVLFLDADIFLLDFDILYSCVTHIRKQKLDLLTCKLRSWNGEYNYIFKTFDIIQAISKYFSPFAVGGFMLFKTDVFRELGGFDKKAKVAEDYLLSKQVKSSKFAVLSLQAFTTPRRFKNKGLWYMVKLFLTSLLNQNKKGYFKDDKGYWK